MEKITGTHLYITNDTDQDQKCLVLFSVNDEPKWKESFLIHAHKVGQIPLLEKGSITFVFGAREWMFEVADLSLTYHVTINTDGSVSVYAKSLSE